mmetsp:Transcript_4476/g.12189  ORF Transcript_4476/g.12189 Transcript_4476/m.12189 type:complete len:263 (-) Transcript_4476:486-1274(-)
MMHGRLEEHHDGAGVVLLLTGGHPQLHSMLHQRLSCRRGTLPLVAALHHHVHHLIRLHNIPDPIGGQHQACVLLLQLQHGHMRLSNHTICLQIFVAKSACHTEFIACPRPCCSLDIAILQQPRHVSMVAANAGRLYLVPAVMLHSHRFPPTLLQLILVTQHGCAVAHICQVHTGALNHRRSACAPAFQHLLCFLALLLVHLHAIFMRRQLIRGHLSPMGYVIYSSGRVVIYRVGGLVGFFEGSLQLIKHILLLHADKVLVPE